MKERAASISVSVHCKVLTEGEEIQCIHNGTFYGSCHVAVRAGRGKSVHTHGLRFKDPSTNTWKTVVSPTTFVRRMLPQHHPAKKQARLNGWVSSVRVRQRQSLQHIKARVIADQQLKADAATDDSTAPLFIIVDIDEEEEDNDDEIQTDLLPVPVANYTERRQVGDVVEALSRGFTVDSSIKFQQWDLDVQHSGDSVLACIVAGALGMNALDQEWLQTAVRKLLAAKQPTADMRDEMEAGYLPATGSDLQTAASAFKIDITLLGKREQQTDSNETQRTTVTTYRAYPADDTKNAALRHVLLQTVRQCNEQLQEPLVVDLLTICVDTDTVAVGKWPDGVLQLIGKHRRASLCSNDDNIFEVKHEGPMLVCYQDHGNGERTKVASVPYSNATTATPQCQQQNYGDNSSSASSNRIQSNIASTGDYKRNIQGIHDQISLYAYKILTDVNTKQQRLEAAEA
jgi:hypothetical protein